jgi:hypothetical protein
MAYLNYGRWVADCPVDGCGDARAVYHPQTGARQTEDVCAKGHAFQIEMPPEQVEARIVAAVADRQEDGDKAWFPKGHGWAEAAGFPTGQTPAELVEEGKHVATRRAEQAAAKRDRTREILADLGIEVRPDGTFSGSL